MLLQGLWAGHALIRLASRAPVDDRSFYQHLLDAAFSDAELALLVYEANSAPGHMRDVAHPQSFSPLVARAAHHGKHRMSDLPDQVSSNITTRPVRAGRCKRRRFPRSQSNSTV